MGDAALQSEFVTDRKALAALEPEWESLYAAGLHEPSTSLEWTMALLDSHLAPADRTLTVVLRRLGTVVAIAPLVIRQEKVAGLVPVATVSPLSELYRTHSDVLGACGRPEVIAALWDSLHRLPQRWDMFRVGRVLDPSPLGSGLRGFLAAGTVSHRMRREHASYLIELPADYEAFLAGRSSRFRNYLKRRTRRLEERGSIEVRRAGEGMPAAEAYRDLLAVEERSWKHEHGSAITAIPRQRAFYRQLCEGAAHRGRLHLTLMYLDGTPVAFNLGMVQGRTYYYLKTSYAAELRPLGPATVFRALLIRSLIAEGLARVDFPGEPYEWEQQWTETVRWNDSFVLFGRGPRAALCRSLMALRGLGRQEHDGRIRFVDPRQDRGS